MRILCLILKRGQIYFSLYQAKSVGQPVLVDDAEMKRVVAKFASYGQQDEK